MKRFVTMLLAVVMLFSLGAVALADNSMNYSDSILPVIEEFEGYEQYQYEDPVGSGVYFIGFGTGCAKDAYPNGVTREEADALLRAYLDNTAVPELNAFLNAKNIRLTQNQFDALVSFHYNLGGGWLNGGNRLYNYIVSGVENYTDAQIADAIGVFGHAGGVAVGGLVDRRIREAQIFLYGDYTASYVSANSTEYDWLIIDKNGGEIENDIFCYEVGKPYGALPTPTLEGKYFAGWQNMATGAILKASDIVSGNVNAVATWSDTPVSPFTDVKSDAWYAGAVNYCYANSFISGTSASTFSPNTNMSRSMLVSVLWRMAGKPVVNFAMSYPDVAEGQWYTEAVRWASSEKIASGMSDGRFGVNVDITREQLVTILYNFAAWQGKVNTDGTSMDMAGYLDTDKIASYAFAGMQWAVLTGVIKGVNTANGMILNPKGTAQRSEVAQIIMNYSMI